MTPIERIAYAETALQEGGWYDGKQAHDPNPTMQGVTQKTYESFGFKGSVQFMTEDQRAMIYRAYWTAAECDLFGPLTAPLVFDHAFNGGPGTAHKIVQRSLDLTPDGVFGPKSRAAIAATDDRRLAYDVFVERLIAYDDLTDSAKLRIALKAWVGRLTDYARKYLRPT